ncbi:hypothetical protein B4U80_01967 [Leptotrombidium deliense]|uniref:Uncharacterized protein n=1 Tax=Leptotrombidium deliense TaxID=299467 RepID=A0A443Q7N8_9ACAR|nr:hypothetical protein B4U80_01967 [Leptotrombidium deliense]
MDWPPYSPYRTIGPPQSPQELWSLVEASWCVVRERGYVDRLFKSMPRRIRDVIANKGDFTKY